MTNDKSEKEKSCLEDLKEDYSELKEKFELPSFDEMNKDFQIEKIAEIETDYLIREIRKITSDKFSNYLRLIEAILNPVNSPMFVFSVVKTLGVNEKNQLMEMYKKLFIKEIDVMELDMVFDEEKEADFIKNSFEVWQEIKEEMIKIIKFIKKNLDNKFEANGGNYFG